MAAGGLCFLAGSELKYGVFLLGFLLVAYAYIGHLAYTRWGRIRRSFTETEASLTAGSPLSLLSFNFLKELPRTLLGGRYPFRLG